jgi:hypothetical protein
VARQTRTDVYPLGNELFYTAAARRLGIVRSAKREFFLTFFHLFFINNSVSHTHTPVNLFLLINLSRVLNNYILFIVIIIIFIINIILLI